MKVAVIGAGAGGLVCARELLREGLTPHVLEAGDRVGGTWVYDERPKQHGAMYASLRTNLPTDVMAFTDVPFEHRPAFVGHADVLAYLEAFAAPLRKHIRFGHRVERLTRAGEGFALDGEAFDAVAVCTGHYHQRHVPALPGLETFTGSVMHSHDYRRPTPFSGRRVAVLGAKASGVDISAELAAHANTVWLCARAPGPARAGVLPRAAVVAAENSDLCLADGTRLTDVDDLVLCTGYDYAFGFLPPDLVTVEPKWVHPLWLDMLCIEAPRLAFIGLPFQVVPFVLMELQSRMFAQLLSGRVPTPDAAQMRREHAATVAALDAEGVARRHRFQYGARQFDVFDDLARRVGSSPLPKAFRARYEATSAARRTNPDGYRDA